MPLRRRREEEPGSRAARQGLGGGKIDRSPLAGKAEHPGYRSKKDEQRGGTRREVAVDNVRGFIEDKTTRREKPLRGKEQLQATAREIAKERQKQIAQQKADARKAADAAKRKAREEERQEQKRVNLAVKQAARKEREEQARRDRAAARQARRDRKNQARQQARQAKRDRGRG